MKKNLLQIEIFRSKNKGFTLVEILVASTLFVVISGSLLSLFNYVLKINRRSEALRQASQGARNFMEFLVKEIRNGQIDYYVQSGTYMSPVNNSLTSPCKAPGAAGTPAASVNTYASKENKLGIINNENIQECFYYGRSDGSYIDTIGLPAVTYSGPVANTLVMEKTGVSGAEILNPSNLTIDTLMFLIRPQRDPFVSPYPEVQPMVSIVAKFTVRLPTGEQIPIYYQTSVSTNKYDIPRE